MYRLIVLLFAFNFACVSTASSGNQKLPLANADEAEWKELMSQTRQHEMMGEWEQAANLLDHWELFRPVSSDWYQRRLRCADGTGDIATSLRLRQHLFAQDSTDLSLRIDLADDLQFQGHGAEAISLLAEAAAEERNQALGASMARRALAVILLREGSRHQAAEIFEELAKEATGDEQRGFALTASSIWEELGELEAALRCLESVLNPQTMDQQQKEALARLQAFSKGKAGNVQDAVNLLRFHQDPEIRLAGIAYLARDVFPGDVDVFLDALSDPDARVVQVALNQLGLRGEVEDVDYAVDFLSHDILEVRIAACGCLERGGGWHHIEALLPLLDIDNRAQFRAARRAIQTLSGTTLNPKLDPNLHDRRAITDAWRLWWTDNRAQTAPK